MKHCGEHGWYGQGRSYCPECVRRTVAGVAGCFVVGLLFGVIVLRLLGLF